MPSPGIDSVQGWQGRTMTDPAGTKIGTIADIYLDDDTGQPEWATVKTGLLGGRHNFVPLAQARPLGDHVQVPYDKDRVKNAPAVPAEGQLSQDQEATLYRYYGLAYTQARSGTGLPTTGGGEAPGGAVGRDTSGPTTDQAMTRSEEELRVGTARQERGRVRLRKYVTTQQRQVSVPVRREEVRVEREPVSDANLDAAMAGPAISEEEHEVVLHQEEPVVQKRVVPKERVRLGKQTVTEQEQVSEQVRQEHVQVEGEDRLRRRGQR